jgi:hypothetical protein
VENKIKKIEEYVFDCSDKNVSNIWNMIYPFSKIAESSVGNDPDIDYREEILLKVNSLPKGEIERIFNYVSSVG